MTPPAGNADLRSARGPKGRRRRVAVRRRGTPGQARPICSGGSEREHHSAGRHRGRALRGRAARCRPEVGVPSRFCRLGRISQQLAALLGSEPPVSRILFPGAVARGGVTVMHLARRLPDGSSDLPGSSDRRPSGASLFGLAPCGVYRALDITAQAVRSYRTFSPLPLPEGRGGLFSVALSFRSPGLGVTQRTAFWSSDFPPAPGGAGDRLNDSNRGEFYRPAEPDSHGGRRAGLLAAR